MRRRAEERGIPVGGSQFKAFVRWGLLPERPGGGWAETDVERLVRIRQAEVQARPLPRRVILLRDLRWPTPTEQLRQAMIDTIPSIAGPFKKLRNVYRAIRVLHGEIPPGEAAGLPVPPDWRPPGRTRWQEVLRWPKQEEFEAIAGSVYAEAHALTLHPRVKASRVLEGIPFEELVVLLMTRQLMIGEQLPPPIPAESEAVVEGREGSA